MYYQHTLGIGVTLINNEEIKCLIALPNGSTFDVAATYTAGTAVTISNA